MNRQIKSFVLRSGRITRAQEEALDSLWHQYGLILADSLLDYHEVFERDAPIVLEIGFGMGASFVDMALMHPERNYLGVEVHRPGVGSCLNAIEKLSLKNVRIFNDDVNEVFAQMIPDHSLDIIQIFFPDPWPKKRHHKRRLIQKPFLDMIYKKLKSKGILHIATDWENYAEWIELLLKEDPHFSPSKSVVDRPETKFERRGKALGHSVWDFVYEAK